jgi:hypothetical protein
VNFVFFVVKKEILIYHCVLCVSAVKFRILNCYFISVLIFSATFRTAETIPVAGLLRNPNTTSAMSGTHSTNVFRPFLRAPYFGEVYFTGNTWPNSYFKKLYPRNIFLYQRVDLLKNARRTLRAGGQPGRALTMNRST